MAATDAAPSQSRGSIASLPWDAALLVLLFAGLATRVLTYELRLDEQLYIPPAALLAEQALYADFFYNHPPLSALYFRLIHLLTGAEDLVRSARFGVVLAWGATLALVWGASFSLSRSRLVALFCVLALEVNVYLLTVVGMTATNNFLQIGPIYAGLALFAHGALSPSRRALWAFLSGVSLSLAIGVKLSAVYYVPPLAVATLFVPWGLPFRQRLLSMTLPMALGGLIGALPLAAFLLADPDRFLSHIVGYHLGPHVAYWDVTRHVQDVVAFGIGEKLRLAFDVWFQGSNLLILAAVVALGGLGIASGRQVPWDLWSAIGLATLFAAGFSFLPTPSFPQYFVPPLAGLVLMPALLWRAVDDGRRVAATPILIALAGLMVVVGSPRLLESSARLALGGPTTADRVEAAADQLRAALPGEAPGPVATLAPVYVLEAELPVYPEFATGQFAYRVAPMAPPEMMSHYVTTGPEQVGQLFDADPPAALLTGFSDALEAPMIAWARGNGYAPVPAVSFQDRYGTAVLWLPEAQ